MKMKVRASERVGADEQTAIRMLEGCYQRCRLRVEPTDTQDKSETLITVSIEPDGGGDTSVRVCISVTRTPAGRSKTDQAMKTVLEAARML